VPDPVSWLLVEKGWKVLAADGSEIGKVERTRGDETRDLFDGLAVSTGLLSRNRYVPSERVGEIREGQVHLTLGPDEVDALDQYEEPPPSAEFRPE
jgi:hypothetical protein